MDGIKIKDASRAVIYALAEMAYGRRVRVLRLYWTPLGFELH